MCVENCPDFYTDVLQAARPYSLAFGGVFMSKKLELFWCVESSDCYWARFFKSIAIRLRNPY